MQFSLQLHRQQTNALFTSQSKQKVDVFHLQLQNLLYEAKFIQQEINKCQNFRSKIEDIELVDLETFRENAPKEVTADEELMADEHKCTIERLKFELDERVKLTEELKVRSNEKKEIIVEVENRQAAVESLKPLVTRIVESAKPAYKLLEIEEKPADLPMEEQ